jgi:hypothetical protein
VIVADDDRPLVEPLVDALGDTGGVAFDLGAVAHAAVLVASPRAAMSDHVDRLLAAWTTEHTAASVLIVLADGDLQWNLAADSFDAGASTALSRDAQARLLTRPLWPDARRCVGTHLVTRVLAALGAADTHSRPSLPAREPSAPPPTGAAPRSAPARRWTRRLIVAAVLACIVAIVVAYLIESDGESSQGLVPKPDLSAGISPAVFLAIGLALGLGVGLTIGWRRRQARRVASTTLHRPSTPPAGRITLFISHSFETDHQLALRLAADLAADVDVWVAPESIAPGESWLTSVERGLTASRVFLALLSKASLASPWVLKEIQAAMELEVHSRLRLVPVEVEDCDVPILLRTYQTLKLAMGYRELVEQTRRLVNAPA